MEPEPKELKSAERINSTVPGDFLELIDIRVKEERYRSRSAYITGLILFDIATRCAHKVTSDIMRDPPWLQDIAFAEIREAFKEKKESKWLERQLKKLLDDRREEGPPEA